MLITTHWLAVAVRAGTPCDVPVRILRLVAPCESRGRLTDRQTDMIRLAVWDGVDSERTSGALHLCVPNISNNVLTCGSGIVGQAPIWFVGSPTLFIASTSLYAVALLACKELHGPSQRLWMLSAGAIPPGELGGVELLAPGGTLTFDATKWAWQTQEPAVTFMATFRDASRARTLLLDLLRDAVRPFTGSDDGYVLPLSGGYDSRALLVLLKDEGRDVDTITWGRPGMEDAVGSDAYVARRLAREYGVRNTYAPIDPSHSSFSDTADRFLRASDGRTDHIWGYLDGFSMWQRLRDRGVQGVIRGDEAFGWEPVSSEAGVLHRVGLTRLMDYAGSRTLSDIGLQDWESQKTPVRFERRVGEGLPAWRDRLYQTYRIPAILAALSSVKSWYVRVANPLLSEQIIAFVRTLPDHSRTNKLLFRQVVDSLGCRVPYATKSATHQFDELFAIPNVYETVCDELNSAETESLFSPAFRRIIVQRIGGGKPGGKKRGGSALVRIKRLVPRSIRNAVHNRAERTPVNWGLLALRAFLVCRAAQIFRNDKRLVGPLRAECGCTESHNPSHLSEAAR